MKTRETASCPIRTKTQIQSGVDSPAIISPLKNPIGTSGKTLLGGFTIATIIALQPHAVLAQEVEEVVITAEQSEGDQLLDDSASFSAIDGDKLADAGIDNVEDVAAYVPNLALTQTSTGTNIVIRGIGSGVNQGFDQSVGLYIDDVPLPRSQMARAPFLDLAGVQVLRGPQYVRDGNYSLAGSIHLVTRGASDEFESDLDVRLTPSRSAQSILGTISSPIGEKAGIRLALQRRYFDGYIENVAQGRDDGAGEELMGRMVLTYDATDDLAIKFKAEFGSFDTTGRAIEIIQDERVPDVGTFDFGSAAGPGFVDITAEDIAAGANWVVDVNRPPSDVLVNGDPSSVRRLPILGADRADRTILATSATTDLDRSYIPLGVRYDAAADQRLLIDAPAIDSNRVPLNGGRSFLEILEQLYTGIEGPYADRFLPEYRADSGTAAPAGIQDGKLDFRRGTDVDESSKNNSLNLTLNVDQFFGEHKVRAIASYVAYDYEETIDTDFTPVPLFQTDQEEEFSQSFFRLEYTSPVDNPIRFSMGASYLESNVVFSDVVSPILPRPNSQSDLVATFETRGNTERFIDFDPSAPLYTLLGRDEPLIISGAETLVPLRVFEQDATIAATYAEFEFDLTEKFTSSIGLRYTKATKKASRDYNLVWDDRSSIDFGALADIPDRLGNNRTALRTVEDAVFGYELLLGIQVHSDSFDSSAISSPTIDPKGTLRGRRREEQLLPSLNLNYDLNESVSFRFSARMANKLGGYDARSVATPSVAPLSPAKAGTFEFEDEEAITYEVGGNFQFNSGYVFATLFYTDFKDLQVSTSDGGVGTNVRNAGAAQTLGLEIESQFYLTEKLNLNFSGAWIDFEFTDFEFGSCRLGEIPDYVLITALPQTDSFTDRAFIIEQRPDLVNANSTLEEFASAREILSQQITDQQGLLLPVAYGTEPFPGNFPTGTSAAEQIQALVDFGYGYAPFGADPFSNTEPSVDISVYAPEQAGRAPTSLTQFNTSRGRFPYFCDYKGRTNQYVSDLQGTLTLNYDTEVTGLGSNIKNFGASLDVIYNSGYHTTVTLDPDVEQPEFVQFNGRMSLSSVEETWEIAVIGENITNEKIIGYAQETPIASRIIGSKGHFGVIRPGRTFSLNLRYKFY